MAEIHVVMQGFSFHSYRTSSSGSVCPLFLSLVRGGIPQDPVLVLFVHCDLFLS